jgi:NAD(P)-dependent dehydrogenase (short-subunit alcohol dehydrogenase family)
MASAITAPAVSTPVARLGLPRTAMAGQTIIITGSGRGIGREAALACAWLGATVVIAELTASGAEVADEIEATGGRALWMQVDVSDELAVAQLVAETRRQCGPADVLINNAIVCPAVAVVDMPTAQWDRVISVNLRGTFLTCRAVLPAMLARGHGTIINLTSTDAMPGLAAYIASKQGITGFTQSLAAEVGPRGVRVIAFAPGMVDTPGIRAVAPALAPQLGITEAQFLSVALHPAYPGLMPAAEAGAATAYLVARLADDFHGEVVTGYAVLEQAGLIAASPLTPAPGMPLAIEPTARSTPGTLAARQQRLALAEQLESILAATEAEFCKLPIFIRPMARGGFRTRAGQGLPEWRRTLRQLSESWRQGDENPAIQLELARRLGQLLDYYSSVPAETARFSRDPVFLSEVAQTTAQRMALIRELINAVEKAAPQ